MKKNELYLTDLARYSPSVQSGLTTEQVEERKQQGAVNYTKKKYSKSYLSIFAGNVCTFFNLLGLIVCVALICIGATLSRFFFVLIYIANMGIGIIQEIRAKQTIDKLSLVASKKIKVIRNGETVEILSDEIVLDDIILLGLGSQIPTDCKIIEGSIEVNEALLTGESVPIKKTVGDDLFAGSFITSGTCYVQAVKVGKENYIEQLASKAKKYKKPHSELMNSLKWIIKAVAIIIVPIAIAFIIKSLFYTDADWINAIDGTATVVIGMIPSGMFLLTSVALAVGVIKLAKHKTLVQDLYSLEMLARVDTICFDKTGTITDGQMTVSNVIPLNNFENDTISKIMSSMLGSLNDNNQTALALQSHFGNSIELIADTIVPFNSKRKLSAVTFNSGKTYSFGAPEFVLSKAEYKNIEETITNYSKQGLRVLVLAESDTPVYDDIIPQDFKAIAIICISDNIRKEAISTIEWFKQNDVAVKVISGDNPITVSEVSKRAGIINADKYISLEGMSDEEVISVANEYTVFGRVSPEQKALLVTAMKDANHGVAMTGDGVNDLLALKESDCAITVASGSDATRNISHLVLTDNNFNSLPKVVYEGRRVINNVQSSASLFLMKTLFTMIFSIIVLCLPYMQAYPFKLSHMLLLEMFVIGLPSFFLSFQPNDDRVEGKFISHVFAKSLPSALLMVFSVVLVEIFKQTLGLGYSEEIYMTISASVLTFAGLISLFYICLPLNKFRSALIFPVVIIITLIIGYSLIFGLSKVLELYQMMPLSDFWAGLVILFGIVLIDIPLYYLLKKLCLKIKLPKNLIKSNKKEAR